MDSVTSGSYTSPNSTTGSSTVMNGQTSSMGRDASRSASLDAEHRMKVRESMEGQDLLESSLKLNPYEAQKYRRKALWVSWVSIIVTLSLAVAAFTVSVMKNSVSAFGFGFDASLDVLSSIIVLWRYNNAAAVHSAYRECIACSILGVVFILSSLCILGKAIHDLVTTVLPEVDDFLFIVSIVSGVLCLILAVAKFLLGKVLTSRALMTDGFNSLVGGIMGFSILISAEVFKHHDSVWFLDGTIGILIGLTILAYGVKLLIDMVPRLRQTGSYERFE
ncbi:transmembrane protein 163a-like [Engraulis encrasicolus]|uniref:transmembrane protein 163a-like n=1 Tax=Engraulis encrasicolus TaxID=184585 RepID=UPI002FD41FC3